MADTKQAEILGADLVSGGLLVHFAGDLSVLFHAGSLYGVKDDDGNVAVSSTEDEELEDH